MKSLLYITDQQEYADHGTIAPLFGRYLKEHMEVLLVYHTKYKDSFQCKGDECIVPESKLGTIMHYLQEEGMDPGRFDVILVRNSFAILREVLSQQNRFGYKVGFRLSFAKSETAYAAMMAKYDRAFFVRAALQLKRWKERRLIERCDLFLPSSVLMAAAMYPGLRVSTVPLPAGIDPQRIKAPKPSFSKPRRFIYVGSLDPLRRFETILDAFTDIVDREWTLDISTFNPTYLHGILERYSALVPRINILQAADLGRLTEQIRACDIGLALMPALPIFATTLPAKVMDYYAAGVPVLLSDTAKNRDRLNDAEEAFFCAFERRAIAAKLEALLLTDDETLGLIREKGLHRLINAGRSYDHMARQLSLRIASL